MENSISDDEYYREYGLDKDPFPPGVIDKNIYLTPEINRRLKQAKQHVRNSEKVLLVSSAPGAGRSLLAQKLIVLKDPDWRVSLTIANPDFVPESLAHSIIQQLLPDKEISDGMSVSFLHKFLEQSYQEELLPVIIIDDAHKLSFVSLQFILQLADLRYNNSFFRFIFFANESITETLSKPGLAELSDGVIETLYMPSFTREQLPAYLKYRFSSCGEGVEPPFSEKEIEYLHQASGGLPGGINMLARQLMQLKLKKIPARRNYAGLALAFALFFAVSTAYFYYQYSVLKQADSSLLLQSGPGTAAVQANNDAIPPGVTPRPVREDEPSIIYEPLSLKLSNTLTTQSLEDL